MYTRTVTYGLIVDTRWILTVSRVNRVANKTIFPRLKEIYFKKNKYYFCVDDCLTGA